MRAHSSRDYLGQIDKSVPATLRLLRTSAAEPAGMDPVRPLDVGAGPAEGQPDGARLIARP